MDKYRFDYVISYWFLVSYFLFMLKIIPYNPKPAFYFAVAFTMVQLIFFFFTGVELMRIVTFLCVNALMKFIPVYTLINTRSYWKDTQFYIGMFGVYIMWLIINDVNVYEFFLTYLSPNLIETSEVKNKSFTPFNNVVEDLFPNAF